MYLVKECTDHICNHSAWEATTLQTAVKCKMQKKCEFALVFLMINFPACQMLLKMAGT